MLNSTLRTNFSMLTANTNQYKGQCRATGPSNTTPNQPVSLLNILLKSLPHVEFLAKRKMDNNTTVAHQHLITKRYVKSNSESDICNPTRHEIKIPKPIRPSMAQNTQNPMASISMLMQNKKSEVLNQLLRHTQKQEPSIEIQSSASPNVSKSVADEPLEDTKQQAKSPSENIQDTDCTLSDGSSDRILSESSEIMSWKQATEKHVEQKPAKASPKKANKVQQLKKQSSSKKSQSKTTLKKTPSVNFDSEELEDLEMQVLAMLGNFEGKSIEKSKLQDILSKNQNNSKMVLTRISQNKNYYRKLFKLTA